jgi:2,5-dihydroxypyridine 5,6-dioxygenase
MHDYELQQAADITVRELLRLKPGETLAVTADTESDPAVMDAVSRAAFAAGARPLAVWIAAPLGVSRAADPSIPLESLTGLLAGSDAWVELNRKWLLYSTAHTEAARMNRSLRHICLTGLTVQTMVRCIGRVDYPALKRFGEALARVVRDARHIRMCTDRGEDVEFDNVAGRPVLCESGYADTPGSHMMAGQIGWTPALESISGTIVLDGSIAPEIGRVRAPVRIRVRAGRIESMEGGQEARAYESWLKGFGHSQMLSVAHAGLGFNPGARLCGDILQDQRVWGSSTWGFGSIGGSLLPPDGVAGPSHSDAVTLSTTLVADGRQILHNGVVVDEELAGLAPGPG